MYSAIDIGTIKFSEFQNALSKKAYVGSFCKLVSFFNQSEKLFV